MKPLLPFFSLFLHLLFCFLSFFSASLSAQDSLTILFAGDAMMHQVQLDNTRSGSAFDLSGYFSAVEREVKAADIAVVNLEVPLGGEPYSGYPAFSAPDDFAVALQKAGFNFFLLANNHCIDRGSKGLARTLRTLDSLQIRSTGTFLDSPHRTRTYPMLLRKNDFRIIMLNYTYGTNGIRIQPPRLVNYIDTAVMEADMAEAKLFNPDFIIVNMHWGLEYQTLPSAEQRRLATWLVGQGADLVIGCHPHVVQPMELHTDVDGAASQLVVYSLGNFISNMTRENTRTGALLKVVLCRKGLRRYIASAQYALVCTERYQNNRGKEDLRLIPSNSVSDPSLEAIRTLLKSSNIGVGEYFFE